MVFARYVMFSEVYWHHGVRAATAMLQRAFYLLHGSLDLDALFRMTEHEMIDELRRRGRRPGRRGELLDGLFGPTRQLYKRLAQYSFFEQRELYQRLARRPYPWLAACAERFAALVQHGAGPGRGAARDAVRRPAGGPRSAIRRRHLFPQGEPLPAAGRGVAGDSHAGHRAVRRLREAGPHFRPPARSSPTCGSSIISRVAGPGDRADGVIRQ